MGAVTRAVTEICIPGRFLPRQSAYGVENFPLYGIRQAFWHTLACQHLADAEATGSKLELVDDQPTRDDDRRFRHLTPHGFGDGEPRQPFECNPGGGSSDASPPNVYRRLATAGFRFQNMRCGTCCSRGLRMSR